jgi:hypothetical protein
LDFLLLNKILRHTNWLEIISGLSEGTFTPPTLLL